MSDCPKPGIYPGVPEDEYRSWDAVACSDARADVFGRPKPSRALLIGSALHTLALEPSEAKGRYFTTKDDYDLRTSEGKAAMERECVANPGKAALRPKERGELKAMLHALRDVPQYGKVIEAPGLVEVSIVAEFSGVRVKGRIDKFVERDGKCLIVDLKTTSCESEVDFTDSIVGFGYDVAAAWYRALVYEATKRWAPFAWICVSKRTHMAWFQRCEPLYLATGERWIKTYLTMRGKNENE